MPDFPVNRPVSLTSSGTTLNRIVVKTVPSDLTFIQNALGAATQLTFYDAATIGQATTTAVWTCSVTNLVPNTVFVCGPNATTNFPPYTATTTVGATTTSNGLVCASVPPGVSVVVTYGIA